MVCFERGEGWGEGSMSGCDRPVMARWVWTSWVETKNEKIVGTISPV